MSKINLLPPVLERYELKYQIPWSYVEPISDFISLYCDLDAFSVKTKADNYFYKVGSLYFDSPGYEFLKQRIGGKEIRFNMRTRFYGDGDKGPYFLEVKHRTGASGVVTKYRATAEAHQWPCILTDPAFRPPESDAHDEKTNKELFLRLATTYAIEPKILTTYRRRAFFSTIDEYSRVTMDVHMKYRVQDDYNLLTTYGMTHYDNETIYATNTKSGDASVVLELKCLVGEVPYWMLDLIRTFELQHSGFSKYASATLVSHFDNGDWFMPLDRQSYFDLLDD
ncbi:VTC domain-containing protein [Crenothrix sp.]|uniref:VTC domain-containing protein n=1 Tax=Crenothrix sp. TaxID=3100433 RepID=UPI00374CF932